MNELLFSGDVVIYLAGLAATWGGILWRLSSLEKKMDKYNTLAERVAVGETELAALNTRVTILEKAHPRGGN